MTAGARHRGRRGRAQPLGTAVGTAARRRPVGRGMAEEETLNSALKRNIETLRRRREEEEVRASADERLARAVTRFTGSMRFVYLHLVLYGGWIAANLGAVPGVARWDPSFVVLAMIASVEA